MEKYINIIEYFHAKGRIPGKSWILREKCCQISAAPLDAADFFVEFPQKKGRYHPPTNGNPFDIP